MRRAVHVPHHARGDRVTRQPPRRAHTWQRGRGAEVREQRPGGQCAVPAQALQRCEGWDGLAPSAWRSAAAVSLTVVLTVLHCVLRGRCTTVALHTSAEHTSVEYSAQQRLNSPWVPFRSRVAVPARPHRALERSTAHRQGRAGRGRGRGAQRAGCRQQARNPLLGYYQTSD